MIVSMNELDSMTRKAFRGAGYHWGEAEEAGKAAAWLARRGLPVLTPVLQVLDDAQERLQAMRPLSEEQGVTSASGLLCPVLAGIALSDRAGEMKEGEEIRYGQICSPLLIAPFLAAAAEAAPLRFLFESPGGSIEACGQACAVHIPAETGKVRWATLRLSAPGAPGNGAAPSSACAISVAPGQWDRLSSFGARTYVPATAHSRLAGAGAGLQDGD